MDLIASTISILGIRDDVKDSIFGYAPNLTANMIALICFALLLVIHVYMGIKYAQWWFGITIFIFLTSKLHFFL